MVDPADLRREYADAGLHESDVPAEPFSLFERWFAEASEAGLYEPDDRYQDVTARFEVEESVPTPPQWGGFLVTPQVVEFWQGRPGRMHDHLVFRRTAEGAPGEWSLERLAP